MTMELLIAYPSQSRARLVEALSLTLEYFAEPARALHASVPSLLVERLQRTDVVPIPAVALEGWGLKAPFRWRNNIELRVVQPTSLLPMEMWMWRRRWKINTARQVLTRGVASTTTRVACGRRSSEGRRRRFMSNSRRPSPICPQRVGVEAISCCL